MKISLRLFAALYDRYERRERRATTPVRRRLLSGLQGDVLEIGAGTGANLAFYPDSARVIATDYNPHMLKRASVIASECPAAVQLRQADATSLPFPDGHFDAVVAFFVLCSVPHPETAIAEAHRVLRPGGELRLFEHVRSKRPMVASMQRFLSPAWSTVADGCRFDRDTSGSVRSAGFEVETVEEIDLGLMPRLRRELILARKPRGA